jgi:hypothetical protein
VGQRNWRLSGGILVVFVRVVLSEDFPVTVRRHLPKGFAMFHVKHFEKLRSFGGSFEFLAPWAEKLPWLFLGVSRETSREKRKKLHERMWSV